MPKSQFLNLQKIVASAIETPLECADILLLARNLRARAEEVLALAEILDSPRTRQTMRGIAATYEKLAQRFEQQAGEVDGGSDGSQPSRANAGRGRHMPQSSFLHLQGIVRAVIESKPRHECRLALDRARSEMAEISAGTRKAIDESRELMAEADAVLARR